VPTRLASANGPWPTATGKLSQTLRDSLLVLAPFVPVIGTGAILDRYQDLLGKHEAVKSLGDLAAALDHAGRAGLAATHPELRGLTQLQRVLPGFLRSQLRDRPALRAAVDQAHYELYGYLGTILFGKLQPGASPRKRAFGLAAGRAEYANLTAALAYGRQTGQPTSMIIGALADYLNQTQQHGASRQFLDDAIGACPDPATKAQQAELALVHNFAGRAALAQRRLEEATSHYEAEIQLREAADDRPALGVTYHQLGVIAQDQRRFPEAETRYREALDIKLVHGDRHGAASTYHQLGIVARDQRQFPAAETSYRKALDLYLESNDRDSALAAAARLRTMLTALDRTRDADLVAELAAAIENTPELAELRNPGR
jgi:tetratricopeptide (TPR) repeat protein